MFLFFGRARNTRSDGHKEEHDKMIRRSRALEITKYNNEFTIYGERASADSREKESNWSPAYRDSE